MDLNYYTVKQVSTMTGMSTDWLWKQLREERLPHHRLGGSYRFTASDLQALAAQTAVAAVTDYLIPLKGSLRSRT